MTDVQNASQPAFCAILMSPRSVTSRLPMRLSGSDAATSRSKKRWKSDDSKSGLRFRMSLQAEAKAAGLVSVPHATLPRGGAGRESATQRIDNIGEPQDFPKDRLLTSAHALRYYILVLEDKGGVAKSTITQTAYATLQLSGEKILLIDTDVVNSNLSRIGLTEKKAALRASRADLEGFLFEAAEQLTIGDVAGVVIDSGAGGEEYFRLHLASLASELKSKGARLIVMRPLTLSPFVQDNIMSFTREVMTADMGCVIVRNLSQGRSKEDFDDWQNSPERAELLAKGVIECDFETVGAKYSDLVVSVRRTFMDVARLPTSELGLQGRDLEIAERHFTRPVRLFLSRWLLRQTSVLAQAFERSVRRTS